MNNATARINSEVAGDQLTHRVIGCAIRIHRVLGCVLLESAYEAFLYHDLLEEGFSIVRQGGLPVSYRGRRVEVAYTPDLVIDGELIIEIKTVMKLLPVHEAQLLTYLRLSGIPRGLLINFHAHPLRSGIKRLALSRRERSSP
jgi:GxxExxY protein